MFCAISGAPPKIPVVSPKSGHVFEQSLIEQYINEHHKDPINSEPLEAEDLIRIQNSDTSFQPPRQPTLNSIPTLLSSLQNEWDSVALELFSLRKQLEDTRRELSTALYHHDAAVRVAAKAIKERDEAKRALQELSISIGSGNDVSTGDNTEQQDATVTQAELPEYWKDQITNTSTELFKVHKASKSKPLLPANYEFKNVSNAQIGTKLFKSVIKAAKTQHGFVLSSTTGINAEYVNESETLTKHESKTKHKDITAVNIINSRGIVIGSETGKLYYHDNEIASNHQDEIIALLEHPGLSDLVISVDKSGLYSLIQLQDAENGAQVIYNNRVTSNATSAAIHIDGALIAIGTESGEINIIDLRNGEVLTTLKNDDASILKLQFGANGYWLFASSNNSSVSVWDLRKNTSSKVTTSATFTELDSDKSANIVVGIINTDELEIIQYDKPSKGWITKGPFNTSIGAQLLDVKFSASHPEGSLAIDVLDANSVVHKVTLN